MTNSPTGARVDLPDVAVAARKAKHNRGVQTVARAGFGVSGLLQGVIGVLALEVAFGRQAGEADQAGALHAIARAPGGAVVLTACVVGFLALGTWLALSAALARPTAAGHRLPFHVGDAAKAVMYLTLAATATTVLVRGRDDSASSTRDLSGAVLRLPGGQVLLGAVGLATIGIALHLIHKGVRRRFEADLDVRNDLARRPVLVLGIVGYVARGVAVGVVGALVVDAAASLDPARSSGLDAALRAMAELPFGQVVLTVVAVGWLASGVYGFVRAAYATMR